LHPNTVIDKKQEYVDICDRVEVERKFSLDKRKCGMGLIMTRLQETTEHVVALSIFVLNLRKVLCAFLRWLLIFAFLWYPQIPIKNSAFVH
jgi:hypothetical protein